MSFMSEPQLSLKQLRRGPTSTLIFTIVRSGRDPNSITYDKTLQIDNLVQVQAKFVHEESKYQPYVKIKKIEGVQNSAIPITIQCGTYKEQFFCSSQWVEVQLNPVDCFSSRMFQMGHQTNLIEITCYTIEINVTVQIVMPTAFLPNKELYEDTESTDFQLHTSDGTVDVHKAVLFLHSNMFKMMLTREWKESKEGRISMDGITVKTLRHLKDYMYLGILPKEDLEPLLQVAAHYFMDKLRADCSAKLIESVKPENIDRLITLACEFNIPELARGLIFRVPDNVLNSMNNLKINDSKTSK